MCCFAQPVLSVSDTNMFARFSSSDPHSQYLIYQMKFETREPNAMILPIPVALPAREDSVRFISLRDYDHLFSDLQSGFPVLPPRLSRGRILGPMAASEAAAPLVVHDVGEFVASFVPTLADFGRLDPQFVIPPESWSKIPEYADYGFVVFQLKELAGKPHPMAFEFETRWTDRLFFPTVHIHDGEVHSREHFDHMLYLQHPDFDRVVGEYGGPRQRDWSTGWVRSKDNAQTFCQCQKTVGMVAPDQLVHRLEIQGLQPNQDIIRPVSFQAQLFQQSRPHTPVGYQPWPLFTALLGLVGLLWFFRRRERVKASLSAPQEGPESAS